MTDESWHCPLADRDGFVPLRALRKEAQHLDCPSFTAAYPAPALLVDCRDTGAGDEAPADTDDTAGIQLLTTAVGSTAILRYLDKVAFLCKRPGKPFAHLVSVGRSATNDITLAVDSVSKVHGYFVADTDGRWSFTDHGSTNGSSLNGKRLEPGGPAALADGDLLQLGLEASLLFLGPEALYARARER